MDRIFRIEIEQDLIKSFKTYGIEGTEQKIIELYKHNEYLQQQYLRIYKEVIKNGVSYA